MCITLVIYLNKHRASHLLLLEQVLYRLSDLMTLVDCYQQKEEEGSAFRVFYYFSHYN